MEGGVKYRRFRLIPPLSRFILETIHGHYNGLQPFPVTYESPLTQISR